jgi:two-component system, cell cycle sensor histidine kinase and response regulator CckA
MPTPQGAPTIPDSSRILAELTDPLLIVDTGWRITYANPAAETLLGVASGGLVGVDPWTLLGDAARSPFADAFRASMTQQEPERREGYYRTLDRWFEVHSHPISGGLVVIFHDITVRKRRERRADLEHRCTMALATAGDLRGGLAGALREIRLAGDFDYGELWLAEGSARTLRVVARDHDGDAGLKVFDQSATDLSIAPNHGLPGLTWSHGEPIFVADLSADSRFLRKDEAAAAGLRSCAMLPVRSDGRTIGAFGLFSRWPLGHDDTSTLLAGLTEALDTVVGLKRGATELDRLFEVSTDLACVASLDGYFLRVNPAFERVLGFSLSELTSRPYTDFVHPDDRGATQARTVQLREGIEVRQFENRYRTRDGGWRWLSWTAMAVVGEGLIYAFARDVTAERLQQEREALRRDFFAALATGAASQEVLGLLVTAVEAELPGSAASILLLDRDGRLQTACAPRLPEGYTAQVDGLSPGPTAGSCGAAVFHGSEILATDIPTDPHWVLYRDIAERYHLRACWSFPIRASDGAILGALAAYFSVSRRPAPAELDTLDGLAHLAAIAIERHRAMGELQLLRQAVARLNDIVMITEAGPLDSPGPRIQFVNEAFQRLAGWASEEVIGRDPRFLQGEGTDRAALDRIRRALEAGEPVREEVLNYAKDGRAYWVEMDIAPVVGPDGAVTHFVSVERDTTERRALQEQFLQAQKMEAVGRLAGGVAHDFNNMLTAILGFSDVILSGEPTASPWRGEVEQIRLAARRAADLTRQLLAFSRRQVLQPRVLDLRDLVRDMDRLLRRLIGEHIELVTTLCHEAATARVDPTQLEQAVVNLVVNAADAMPAGGRLTLEVARVTFDESHATTHAGVTTGPHVMLAVTDTGIGMEPEVLQRAFEPFFTTKPQGVGTGLGLSSVYGIVTQGDGHLHAESEPGLGTTIRLYFRAVDLAPMARTPATPSDALHGGSETILVVEDEEMVRQLLVRILERQGYRVLSAAAGDEALARSAEFEGTIDLLVTDVVMPRMTGDRLAERLVVERPGLKVLYLSGYTEDTIVHHGVLDAGVNFLEKPFTHDGLARKVREVLDGNGEQGTGNREQGTGGA